MIRAIINAIGWSTKRKIIVIESDDWGSVRMPSRKAYERLQAAGLPVNQGSGYRYNGYDKLESPDDIIGVLEVLRSVRDSNGRHAVLTAMMLMANPDFEKIRADKFARYYWEPFTQTYERYGYGDKSWNAIQQGTRENLLDPQFHGREHLNVPSWLRALQAGDSFTLVGFEEGFWGFRSETYKPIFQAAYDYWEKPEIDQHREAITDGITLFNQLLGYAPSHFAAPNGALPVALESTCAELGIQSFVSSRKQPIPLGGGKYKNVWRRPGQKNAFGQRYIMRNCFFEPNSGTQDWVSSCLKDIDTAFKYKKPAIIGNHRTSFMGGIDPNNRDQGLLAFKKLLQTIVAKWPEVEFMTSVELVETINLGSNSK